ncbi:unnamed protein product [Amoebophrya sp. A120]|nr:unnamed protein product [Amoebophrya sp. A120]|eukprot:GSA120T00004945001.1
MSRWNRTKSVSVTLLVTLQLALSNFSAPHLEATAFAARASFISRTSVVGPTTFGRHDVESDAKIAESGKEQQFTEASLKPDKVTGLQRTADERNNTPLSARFVTDADRRLYWSDDEDIWSATEERATRQYTAPPSVQRDNKSAQIKDAQDNSSLMYTNLSGPTLRNRFDPSQSIPASSVQLQHSSCKPASCQVQLPPLLHVPPHTQHPVSAASPETQEQQQRIDASAFHTLPHTTIESTRGRQAQPRNEPSASSSSSSVVPPLALSAAVAQTALTRYGQVDFVRRFRSPSSEDSDTSDGDTNTPAASSARGGLRSPRRRIQGHRVAPKSPVDRGRFASHSNSQLTTTCGSTSPATPSSRVANWPHGPSLSNLPLLSLRSSDDGGVQQEHQQELSEGGTSSCAPSPCASPKSTKQGPAPIAGARRPATVRAGGLGFLAGEVRRNKLPWDDVEEEDTNVPAEHLQPSCSVGATVIGNSRIAAASEAKSCEEHRGAGKRLYPPEELTDHHAAQMGRSALQEPTPDGLALESLAGTEIRNQCQRFGCRECCYVFVIRALLNCLPTRSAHSWSVAPEETAGQETCAGGNNTAVSAFSDRPTSTASVSTVQQLSMDPVQPPLHSGPSPCSNAGSGPRASWKLRSDSAAEEALMHAINAIVLTGEVDPSERRSAIEGVVVEKPHTGELSTHSAAPRQSPRACLDAFWRNASPSSSVAANQGWDEQASVSNARSSSGESSRVIDRPELHRIRAMVWGEGVERYKYAPDQAVDVLEVDSSNMPRAAPEQTSRGSGAEAGEEGERLSAETSRSRDSSELTSRCSNVAVLNSGARDNAGLLHLRPEDRRFLPRYVLRPESRESPDHSPGNRPVPAQDEALEGGSMQGRNGMICNVDPAGGQQSVQAKTAAGYPVARPFSRCPSSVGATIGHHHFLERHDDAHSSVDDTTLGVLGLGMASPAPSGTHVQLVRDEHHAAGQADDALAWPTFLHEVGNATRRGSNPPALYDMYNRSDQLSSRSDYAFRTSNSDATRHREDPLTSYHSSEVSWQAGSQRATRGSDATPRLFSEPSLRSIDNSWTSSYIPEDDDDLSGNASQWQRPVTA